jgi:pSer/pThr/pTyr-binding forkhead associated (FHA) protein
MTSSHLLLILRILIALTLYAFLGTVLLLLWRDLRSASRAIERVPYARLELRDGDSTIEKFQLVEFNSVGREPGSTISLQDDTVSSNHANIIYERGHWLLEDLGSHNGTIVNEIRIEDPIVVTHGDQIRFGRVMLVMATNREAQTSQME